MNRLVWKCPDGTFGVEGIDLKSLPKNLYMCIVKLMRYEETELNPDDVERLIYENQDLKAKLNGTSR